jgi:hypothetical protein
LNGRGELTFEGAKAALWGLKRPGAGALFGLVEGAAGLLELFVALGPPLLERGGHVHANGLLQVAADQALQELAVEGNELPKRERRQRQPEAGELREQRLHGRLHREQEPADVEARLGEGLGLERVSIVGGEPVAHHLVGAEVGDDGAHEREGDHHGQERNPMRRAFAVSDWHPPPDRRGERAPCAPRQRRRGGRRRRCRHARLPHSANGASSQSLLWVT